MAYLVQAVLAVIKTLGRGGETKCDSLARLTKTRICQCLAVRGEASAADSGVRAVCWVVCVTMLNDCVRVTLNNRTELLAGGQAGKGC